MMTETLGHLKEAAGAALQTRPSDLECCSSEEAGVYKIVAEAPDGFP